MSTINKDPLATVFVPEIEVRMLLHMLVKRVARPSILPMRCDAMRCFAAWIYSWVSGQTLLKDSGVQALD